MKIYLIGRHGELTGPVEPIIVPGVGPQLPGESVELAGELAPAAAGCVWAMVKGGLVQLEDNRGNYYRTTTGEAVTLAELGPVPDGLTALPKPDQFHTWSGGAWVPDQVALAAHYAAVERAWRDGEIAASEWLVSRHRAERDLERATTLTAERFTELLSYQQDLRDWPAADAFPLSADRPVAPAWLAEQVQ